MESGRFTLPLDEMAALHLVLGRAFHRLAQEDAGQVSCVPPHPPACSRRAGGLSPVIPTRPAGVGAMVRRGPKGLSQSNVRQNATVCIRGEPLSAGSPAGRDFSAAARNSSQVLAHSRVTLLFFRPPAGGNAPGRRPAATRGARRAGFTTRPAPGDWNDAILRSAARISR